MRDKRKIIGSVVILVLFIAFLFVGFFMTKHKQFKSNYNDVFVESTNVQSNNSSSDRKITVCIQGEIKNPGVYKLDYGSIVDELIKAAGGFTDGAERNLKLNLAKKLKDEDYIYIDKKMPQGQNSNSAASQTSNMKININSATAEELDKLDGIGPTTAQKIVDYREKNGQFSSLEDLKKIGGIGDKTLNKFKDKVDIR